MNTIETNQATKDNVMTLMFHRKNLADQTITISRNAFRVIVLSVFLFAIAINVVLPEIIKRRNQVEMDGLKPRMVELANKGEESAALWLVLNYGDESRDRLVKLANNGNPTGLYLQSFVENANGNVAARLDMLKKAAEKGYAPAIYALHRLETTN